MTDPLTAAFGIGAFLAKLTIKGTKKIYKIYEKIKPTTAAIAIIGPNTAGKTTLFDIFKDTLITENKIKDTQYIKTQDSTIVAEKITMKWNPPRDEKKNKKETIKLKIIKPKDVGGEESIRDSLYNGWLDVCKNANALFYIFDSAQFDIDPDRLIERIKKDFEWIAENAQNYAVDFRIFVFANKIDLIKKDEDIWAKEQIPKIDEVIKKTLKPYHYNHEFVMTCSLLTNKGRTKAINSALNILAGKG